ncbi:MAG: hypothetical protein HOM11_14050 [Methylococcales bacterium]|jgi:hypothetical protein|nr:hypothetical protein [Methylococcales bacterium]MBT7443468.1 hypothetical protein [Methylococcales bacterium]
MANFNTHISVGMLATGLAVSSLAASQLINGKEAGLLFLAGSIGSLLPDIDSDNSLPVKTTFSVMGIISAFIAATLISPNSIFLVMAISLSAYALIRWGVFYIFTQLTVHRGIIHSVPFGLWLGLLVAIGYQHLTNQSVLAWLMGGFVSFGFMVHLLLDEFYSVDLLGGTVKRSFGSAFKFFSFRAPFLSILIYAALWGTYHWFAPPLKPLIQFANNAHHQQKFQHIFSLTQNDNPRHEPF